MVPKLYVMDISPPSRATLMACEIFGIPVELNIVNIFEKENFRQDYLKKNPLHTVPVFKDGDFILHDSHAIIMYLADNYAKDDCWYPKDVKQRALVNQKLFFESSILFPTVRNITRSIVVLGHKTIDQTLLDDMEESYGYIESFLQLTKFIATDKITIADVSAISNITFMRHFVPINDKKYPKTTEWVRTMEQQPYHQKHNVNGANKLAHMIKNCLNQSQ